MAIDTLAYTKALEAAGVERRIAEVHAEALAKFALADLATKADIERLETATKTDLRLLQGDIQRLEGKWTVLMWAVGINAALTVAILGVLLRAGHG
jgi:hypothetical protein